MTTMDNRVMVLLTAVVAGVLGWSWWTNSQQMAARGGAHAARDVAPSSEVGAALDATLGIRNPIELAHFGPGVAPSHWVPHRVSYPAIPGAELQRLIHGAPFACNTTTRTADQGWLFHPPSEVDY